MSMSDSQSASDSSVSQPQVVAPAASTHVVPVEQPVTPLQRAVGALPPLMHRAFVLATQGVGVMEIAKELGIGRTTLFRWSKLNPKYRAALNAWRQDQVQSGNVSVLALMPDIVDRLRRSVSHDTKLALKLADKLGVLQPPPNESFSPKRVREEIKIELRREKLRARRRLEKLRVQEVNQRAQELEDKLEADRIENIRKMDPADVHRQREMNARIEQLAEKLREARKHDPDYKLDATYVRAFLQPEEFQKEKVAKEQQQQQNGTEKSPYKIP